MRRVVFSILMFSTFLAGCGETSRYHDPSLKLEQEDYKELLAPFDSEQLPAQPLPKRFRKNYETAQREVLPAAFSHPVSLSISDATPLKDVFLEIARQAKVNMIVNPKVSARVNYQIHNRPFIEVIDHLCEMTDLRFRVVHGTVRVETDTPYLKTYDLQFLSVARTNKNHVSVATDVFSSLDGFSKDQVASGRGNNGSGTYLENTGSTDFWKELEENLKIILRYHAPAKKKKKKKSSNGKKPKADSKKKQRSSEDKEKNRDRKICPYSLHKQAGIVTVYGTSKAHRHVQEYVQKLKETISIQVLIEAKIVEVNLKDEFKSGINWHSVNRLLKVTAPLGDLARAGPFNEEIAPDRNVFTLGGSNRNLTSLASFLSKFGTVRTLSSPRMTVINNQAALMKVATNQVFFKVRYSRDTKTHSDNGTISEGAESDIKTIPIGLVMVVHPSVDMKSGQITMMLRPTVTRVVGEEEDPSVAVLSGSTRASKIPVVQIRELDSMLSVQPGEVIVMGGLMEERGTHNQSGVPGVQNVSVLGEFFKGRENEHTVTELVILLKATVLEGNERGTTFTPADQRVYEKFTHDPRRFESKAKQIL